MGLCFCNNKFDEAQIYINFLESLKINTIKSEDLIKKLKEKYLTVIKEDKKKSKLLDEIIPLMESTNLEWKEYSQKYLMEYFEENKNNFFAIILFCDSRSKFKKSFEEIIKIYKKESLMNFSENKDKIKRRFLKDFAYDYLRFSTVNTITIIRKLSESE